MTSLLWYIYMAWQKWPRYPS